MFETSYIEYLSPFVKFLMYCYCCTGILFPSPPSSLSLLSPYETLGPWLFQECDTINFAKRQIGGIQHYFMNVLPFFKFINHIVGKYIGRRLSRTKSASDVDNKW